jgi:gephyrin
VYKKPVVAVLSTGDDIYDIATATPSEGGAWDTNRPSLIATLKSMFYEVIDLGIVSDELRSSLFSPSRITSRIEVKYIYSVQSHMSAMSIALQQADVIIVTGSTSLKPVIERQFQGTIHFGRVNVKPGKLTTFATIPAPAQGKGKQREAERDREVPLFSLSENPVNALVTFYVYVLPALRRLGGWQIEACQLPRVKVEVSRSYKVSFPPSSHLNTASPRYAT